MPEKLISAAFGLCGFACAAICVWVFTHPAAFLSIPDADYGAVVGAAIIAELAIGRWQTLIFLIAATSAIASVLFFGFAAVIFTTRRR